MIVVSPAVLLQLLVAVSFPAYAFDVSIISQYERSLTVEISVNPPELERVAIEEGEFVVPRLQGYSGSIETGLPVVPERGMRIGVPFDSNPRVTVESVDWQYLGDGVALPAYKEYIGGDEDFRQAVTEFAMDTDFYESGRFYPESVLEDRGTHVLRDQKILLLRLRPVRFDAGTETFRYAKAIRATVEFERDGDYGKRLRPSAGIDASWENAYRSVVINHDQARKWRRAPKPVTEPLMKTESERYKLSITETGIYKLSYSELAESGLDSEPEIQTVSMHFVAGVRHTVEPDSTWVHEIPIHVVEVGEGDGLFNGNDYVLFFAEGFFDKFVNAGYEDKYSRHTYYYFSHGGSNGLRMEERSAWRGYEGLTPPTSFEQYHHFEEDRYMWVAPSSDSIDFWHWTQSPIESQYETRTIPFHVYSPANAPARIVVRIQGTADHEHPMKFSLGNGTEHVINEDFSFFGEQGSMSQNLYDSGWSIPRTYLSEGDNYFKFEGDAPGWPFGLGVGFDYLDIWYRRQYEARENLLIFSSDDEVGRVEIQISNFETDSLFVFNVTDPEAPFIYTLSAENIVPDGGDFTLVLQDSITSRSRYASLGLDAAGSVLEIEKLPSPTLRNSEGDYIIIAHEDFLETVASLASYRSADYEVQVVEVGRIFDEFNGGYKSPHAIKAYLRYGYDNWSMRPDYVVLVGDANLDYKHLDSDHHLDYVSTYNWTEPGSLSEIVASDVWFVSFDGPLDYFYDCFIGRISCGSEEELTAYLSKLISYEEFSDDDDWRKRFIMLADDAWSTPLSGGSYSYHGGETQFESGTGELEEIMLSSPGARNMDIIRVNLADWTHPFNEDQDPPNVYNTAVYVRDEVTPILLDGVAQPYQPGLSDGCFFWNFQGHASRKQLTHEVVFVEDRFWGEDVAGLTNNGKPFVFLGYGCHISDFDVLDEHRSTIGDALTERMLFHPEAGAIATFASSGYELLSPNVKLNKSMYRALFEDVSFEEIEDGRVGSRWILGEVALRGVWKYVGGASYVTAARTHHILGDPALKLDLATPDFEVTVNGETVSDGRYLEPGEFVSIVARIRDEVSVTSISVEETDTGVLDPSEYSVDFLADTLADFSRDTKISYETVTRRDSGYDIVFSATDASGREANFTLQVGGSAGLKLQDSFAYPNPFEESTDMFYTLSTDVKDVDVKIFTVSGRMIRELRGTVRGGINSVTWDGRDDEGDQVANGMYFFKIEVEAFSGQKKDVVGKMYRAR
jgi:hypothetical protein